MTHHVLLQPYKPTPEDPFDAVKAAHLLNRAGFGGTAAEVAKVQAMGPAAAVDWLLDFKDAPAEQQGNDVPDLSSIEGFPKTYREIQELYAGKSEDEKKIIRQQQQKANNDANRATVHWWLKRMAFGPSPLQEKLTLFWHGHFVTSDKDERSAMLMWRQNELLRTHAAGNFRTFVRAVARDPAMIDYLNNNSNRKAHPNENFAREVMELFTLGIGNYTEQDVKEGARAFTGWAHDGDDFVYRKFDHDKDVKHFMGRVGTFDGDDVIEILLEQKQCAKFIAAKLFRYFVYEEMDDGLVESVGNELREARYDLRPLLKVLLTSKAFYGPLAVGTQIKSPIHFVLGTVRLAGLQMPPGDGLMYTLRQMGQVPFAPPNVRGWPGGRIWINTSTLFVRVNTAAKLVDGKLPRVDAAKFADDAPSHDPAAVVDYWVDRLVQRPVADDKKRTLAATFGGKSREQDVRTMIQLIVAMPEFQLC